MLGRVASEGGRWTRNGLPVGWDFPVFRGAGAIVASENAELLYDAAMLERVAKQALPGDYPVFPYLNPPHFAAAYAPFASVSYAWGFAIATALGLVCLFHALRSLLRETDTDAQSRASAWKALIYALSSYPVVVGLFAGQSCFFSLWLMAMTCVLALRGRAFAAGCVAGVLLYKPQLVLGFLVLFAVYRPLRVRALAGFSLSAVLSLVANLLVSVEASRIYLGMLDELPNVQARFRLAFAFTGRALFEQLLPAHARLSSVLAALLSLICVLAYAYFARSERRLNVLLAGAVWLSLAAAAHASIYEWTLLLAPFVLLRRELDERRWTFVAAMLYLVCFASPPIAELMTDHLGAGVQLAVPALIGAGFYVARSLRTREPSPA